MSDVTNETTEVIERDPSIDVLNAMKVVQMPAAADNNTETYTQDGMPEKETSKAVEQAPAEVGNNASEHKSAITRAMEAKKHQQTGLWTDQKAAAEEAAPKRPAYDSDEAREEFAERLDGLDSGAIKASKVVVIKQPTNQTEYSKMLSEVEETVIDSNGNAVVPEGAEYIIAKTPEVIAEIERRKERDANQMIDAAGDSDYEGQPLTDVSVARQGYKDSVVKILIDKTNMGANITFDDEEKKIIERSNVIQLCEVEDMDLKVIEVDRPDDAVPFMQMVEARQLSVSKVPMAFPMSGFKAQMCGLSWGEYADITLDTDSEDATDYLSFDKLYKRYSTVYNNMKNVSVGPFKNFDEFLHKFAHDDLDLAIYGLVIATQPERDTLNMSCTKPSCKRSFVYTYSPRGVIDFDTAPVTMLEAIDAITDAGPDERLKLFNNSRVNKFKRILLPCSQYVVDIGAASAWDYLYQILPVIQEYSKIEDQMSDTDPRKTIPTMLFGVRNIFVPSTSGGYIRASKGKDVADVLLSLPTQDAMTIDAAVKAYRRQFTVGFSLKNIECPHCHTKTPRIPIDIDTLVFQIRLRQLSTRAVVKNFPDF